MNSLRLVPPGAVVHDVESVWQEGPIWIGRCTCGWTTRSRVGREWVEGQLQTHLDRDTNAPRIHPSCGGIVEREELGKGKFRCTSCGSRYIKATNTFVFVPRVSE